MKFLLKIKCSCLAAILLFLPIVASAQGLVPCSGADCGFDHLVILVNRVIDYLLVNIAIPLAAIMFAVGGFKIMMAGGESGKISEGKKVIIDVLYGLLIAFLAWVIVHTLLDVAGLDSSYSFLELE